MRLSTLLILGLSVLSNFQPCFGTDAVPDPESEPDPKKDATVQVQDPDQFLEEAKAPIPNRLPYRKDLNIRILDGRKNILSEDDFQKHWPPRHPNDLTKFEPGEFGAWSDLVGDQVKKYFAEYVMKATQASEVKQAGSWSGWPKRAYPYCVDGFRPFAFRRKNWTIDKPLRHHPALRIVDDDLYRFIPYFQLSQPTDGIPNVMRKNNAAVANWDKTSLAGLEHPDAGNQPYLKEFSIRLMKSPTHNRGGIIPQQDKPGLSFAYFRPLKKDSGSYFWRAGLDQWVHLVFKFHTKMQGLFIQAIGYPMGLPFGTFSDHFDCRFDDGVFVPKVMDYRQRMRFNHPQSDTRKINTVIPCKYNHGNNQGAYFPSVYAYGGSRKTKVEEKFDIFRVHFTWINNYNCHPVERFQFLVLAVKSFINAQYEVFLTRNLAHIGQYHHQVTVPYIEDWRDQMLCGIAETPVLLNLDSNTFSEGTRRIVNDDTMKSVGIDINPFMSNFYQMKGDLAVTVVWAVTPTYFRDITPAANLPIPYDRSYDDCIQDLEGHLLDSMGNCPPKTFCHNTKDKFMQWNEKAFQEKDKVFGTTALTDHIEENEILGGYWNPVSIVRFMVHPHRFWRHAPEHWFILENCGKPLFCKDARETIPYLKVKEDETNELLNRNDQQGRTHSGCTSNRANSLNDLHYYRDDPVCSMEFVGDETQADVDLEDIQEEAHQEAKCTKIPAATEPLFPDHCPYGKDGPGGPGGPGGPTPAGEGICKLENLQNPTFKPYCPFGPYGTEGPFGPKGPYGPEGEYGPGGIYGEYGLYGLYGEFGQFGPHGPDGPYSNYNIYGPYGLYGPYGPYGEFGPYSADSPYGPNGPYGPYGPFGPFGLYGRMGPYGPLGPFGPGGPESDVEDRSWETNHTENVHRSYIVLYRKAVSNHIWCMIMAWFVLLSIGTFTARYYKETAAIDLKAENSLLGLGAWIWIHIFTSLLALTLMWVGISEALLIRQKQFACSILDTYMGKDIRLKNFCRWRKEIIRYHQAVGYASVIVFHFALVAGWFRPVGLLEIRRYLKVTINLRKWFFWIHFVLSYLSKVLSFICVMVLLMPKGFSICADIPYLVIIMEVIALLFSIAAWVFQYYEDLRAKRADRGRFPVIEAIRCTDNLPTHRWKLMLYAHFIGTRFFLFGIVWRSIHTVYKLEGAGAELEGEFEIREGLFSTCRVASRASPYDAMLLLFDQQYNAGRSDLNTN